YDAMVVLGVGAGGHVLLAEHQYSGSPRVWVFHDGTLSFVWAGSATDINADGTVIGSMGGSNLPYMWTAAAGPVQLVGLSSVGAINDHGDIVGVIQSTSSYGNPGSLGLWRDGTIRFLTVGPDVSTSTMQAGWIFRDFDNDGRVLAFVVTNSYRGPNY